MGIKTIRRGTASAVVKVTTLIVALLLAIMASVGCSSSGSSSSSSAAEAAHEDAEVPTSVVLIAYFSQTGNTKAVATDIADITGGDLFEIVPAEPYTDEDVDYTKDGVRAKVEQDDADSRPEIADTVVYMEDYEIVFLGFPIWWGEEPRIIDTFLESYDFDGKTIIPFCTSDTTGISGAEDSMKALLGNGVEWMDGMRFPADASFDDVLKWLDELDLSFE